MQMKGVACNGIELCSYKYVHINICYLYSLFILCFAL